MAWQEFKTLQAAESEHVAKCFGLYHFDPNSCAAEGNPTVQSMHAILHGSFAIRRSKSSTKSTKSTKTRTGSSSPEPLPVLEKPQLCALVMERFDCSLHDLTFVNLMEPEVTSFARVGRLYVWYFDLFSRFGKVKALTSLNNFKKFWPEQGSICLSCSTSGPCPSSFSSNPSPGREASKYLDCKWGQSGCPG